MNEVKFNPKEHMIDLKGKQYLPVAWRLVWFRQEHSGWGITTEMMHFDPEAKYAIFRATVCDADGVPKASAYGSESAKDFSDYLEKAETKSVGRALAMLGYGTQFAPELDEGQRIADAPVQPASKPKSRFICKDCGAALVNIQGKDGKEIDVLELNRIAMRKYGRTLCPDCCRKQAAAAKKLPKPKPEEPAA